MAAARKEISTSRHADEVERALEAMDQASQIWRQKVGDAIIRLGRNAATAPEGLKVAGSPMAADVMQNYRDVVAQARATIAAWSASAQARQDGLMSMLLWIQFGGALLLIAIAAIIGWRLAATIVQPLAAMTSAMENLAAGDVAIVVPALGRNDEIGDMAKALQSFRVAAVERIRMETEATANRAELDEAKLAIDRQRDDADVQKAEELRRMVELVERETRDAVQQVVAMMDDMTGITASMSQTSALLSNNSEAVAAAAHQTQATMQGARASTERLTHSIE